MDLQFLCLQCTTQSCTLLKQYTVQVSLVIDFLLQNNNKVFSTPTCFISSLTWTGDPNSPEPVSPRSGWRCRPLDKPWSSSSPPPDLSPWCRQRLRAPGRSDTASCRLQPPHRDRVSLLLRWNRINSDEIPPRPQLSISFIHVYSLYCPEYGLP